MTNPYKRLAASIAIVATLSAPAARGASEVDPALSWGAFTSTPVGASLAAIAARTSKDVWAVGLHLGGPCQFQTLTERFDGTSWRVVPNPIVQGSVLADVAALARNDAWVVGSSGCDNLHSETLAEHWDGASWTLVPTPSPGTFDVLAAVAAISPTDVWALGSTQQGATSGTLAEHWDGASWSIVASPSVTAVDELAAASASSTSDVWAVGSGPSGDSDTPVALHWDGSTWQAVAVPTPGNVPGFLSGVFTRGPSDAWAVGGYRPEAGSVRPLALHWDGQGWHRTRVPVAGTFVVLESVSGAPGGGVWASGFTVDEISSRAIVLRHTGMGWVVVDPPATTDVFDLSVLPGGELWGVSGADVVHGLP
jgi:hypothetical protein